MRCYIEALSRREQAKRDKAVSSFLPCEFKTGGVMLMGNRRWIVILRYVMVTIVVLWLLTIKAC